MITVNGQVLLRSVIMDGIQYVCQSVVMSYQISNNNILFQAVTMTDNSVCGLGVNSYQIIGVEL